jgi:hypothetical protein
MKAYPYEVPSPQLGYAVRQLKMADTSGRGCGDDVDRRQQPFRGRTGNPYGRQLFWHLIATLLLAAIAALVWLSLIGPVPGAYAHIEVRTNPAKQSISATTSP